MNDSVFFILSQLNKDWKPFLSVVKMGINQQFGILTTADPVDKYAFLFEKYAFI